MWITYSLSLSYIYIWIHIDKLICYIYPYLNTYLDTINICTSIYFKDLQDSITRWSQAFTGMSSALASREAVPRQQFIAVSIKPE